MPGQPGHVERLILAIGERQPHRLAAPPRGPLKLGNPGEIINDAHVKLDQPKRQVGPNRRRRRGPTTPPTEPAIHRKGRAAGPNRKIQGQHDVDLIQPKERGGRAIGIRNRRRQREHRRHPSQESNHEQEKDHHRDGMREPDRLLGHQPPERIRIRVGLERSNEVGREPARGAEKALEPQPPDGVGIKQHRPRRQPDEPQQGRLDGREPKRIPPDARGVRGTLDPGGDRA